MKRSLLLFTHGRNKGGCVRAESGVCEEDRTRVRSSSAFVCAGAGGVVRVSRSRASTVNPQLAAEVIAHELNTAISVPRAYFSSSVVESVPKESATSNTVIEAVFQPMAASGIVQRGLIVENRANQLSLLNRSLALPLLLPPPNPVTR